MPKFVKKPQTQEMIADSTWANEQEDRIAAAVDPLYDVGIQRILNDTSGWTVIEYIGGYTKMTKVFEAKNISFVSSGGVFSKTVTANEVTGGMAFPYALNNVKYMAATAISVGAANISVWNNNFKNNQNGITEIRFSSDANYTRDLRFGVVVEGFRQ